MQKSPCGLLQSLLHQILAFERGAKSGEGQVLVSRLCEYRWFGTQHDTGREWSYEELFTSPNAIEACDYVKIFLLIDGVDEHHPHSGHAQLMPDSRVLACIST